MLKRRIVGRRCRRRSDRTRRCLLLLYSGMSLARPPASDIPTASFADSRRSWRPSVSGPAPRRTSETPRTADNVCSACGRRQSFDNETEGRKIRADDTSYRTVRSSDRRSSSADAGPSLCSRSCALLTAHASRRWRQRSVDGGNSTLFVPDRFRSPTCCVNSRRCQRCSYSAGL